MKLLVLMPNFPSPTWGAGKRNYYFLQALAARYEVSLLCLVDRLEEGAEMTALTATLCTVKRVMRPRPFQKRLQQVLDLVRGRSYFISLNTFPEVQAALDELLRVEHYDAVLFEGALMADYRLPDGIKRIIDQHNIEYELLWRTYKHEISWLRKWYNWRESLLLRPAELALCAQADLVLATSAQDRQLLQERLPQQRIEVVPNGVDIELFQNHETEIASEQLIFTGAMNYYPNIAAVVAFARQSWPLIRAEMPHATWQIVGREPPPEVLKLGEMPGITVTGTVPDVRPYLASSTLAIVPLLFGGGTRLKILEAFAMNKAVISTSLGCEGLAVTSDKHLLVAERPEEFAQAVVELLRDPARRAQLGAAGRELVEQEYSWERSCARLLEVLEQCLQEKEEVRP